MRHCLIALLLLIATSSGLHADRIAVIGGGGAGVCCAWLLDEDHEVTLYEQRDRLGGHADSIDLEIDGQEVVVEGGFEFFTKATYPTFFRLLEHFNVEVNPFVLNTTWYATDDSDVLILPPYFNWRVEFESLDFEDISRMLKLKRILDAGEVLLESGETGMTLGTFLANIKLSDSFKEDFFYPFLGAAWGVDSEAIREFSAYTSLKYLVTGEADGTYEWYEVVGGLKRYIAAVVDDMKGVDIRTDTLIIKVDYSDGVYIVTEANGKIAEYDHLVLATHANQAGVLLRYIPECEDLYTVLSNVRYYNTIIAIHGDARFMPHDEDNWRLVNTRYDGVNAANTMYKRRKGLPPIFKSWITLDIRNAGDTGPAIPEPLYASIYYKHAYINLDYFHAQRFGQLVQGNRNLWLAGSWMWDNDSHESALMSAVKVVERLAPGSDRLKILKGDS